MEVYEKLRSLVKLFGDIEYFYNNCKVCSRLFLNRYDVETIENALNIGNALCFQVSKIGLQDDMDVLLNLLRLNMIEKEILDKLKLKPTQNLVYIEDAKAKKLDNYWHRLYSRDNCYYALVVDWSSDCIVFYHVTPEKDK